MVVAPVIGIVFGFVGFEEYERSECLIWEWDRWLVLPFWFCTFKI